MDCPILPPKLVLTSSGALSADDDGKLSTGGDSSQLLTISSGGKGRPRNLTIDTLKRVVGEIVDDTLKSNNAIVSHTLKNNTEMFNLTLENFTSDVKNFVGQQFASQKKYFDAKIGKIIGKIEKLKVSTKKDKAGIESAVGKISEEEVTLKTQLNGSELNRDISNVNKNKVVAKLAKEIEERQAKKVNVIIHGFVEPNGANAKIKNDADKSKVLDIIKVINNHNNNNMNEAKLQTQTRNHDRQGTSNMINPDKIISVNRLGIVDAINPAHKVRLLKVKLQILKLPICLYRNSSS